MLHTLLSMTRVSAVVVAALSLAAARAQDGSALATITGGRDQSGQNYEWTIRNLHTSPLVYMEFPHYFADMFVPPAGWELGECTNLMRVGGKEAPGVCRASATAENGIQPRLSAKVQMRLGRGGRDYHGKGTVTLRFADGKEARIANVQLPVAPSTMDRFIMPIGFAIVMALIILGRALSRRRQTDGGAAGPTAP